MSDRRAAPVRRRTFVAFLAAAPWLAAALAADGKAHRLVIQVSSADTDTHGGALRNAVNLQNALGVDNVDIEIVAYGPGVAMLLAGGEHAGRVTELAGRGVAFSACGNTLAEMREGGESTALAPGVDEVPAGVLRIIELQERGYTYIRP